MYDAEKTKANYDYYVRNGRCPKCGGANPVMPGKHVCLECAMKESESRRNRRAWRRENGLCTRCGKPLQDGATFKQCDDCRKYTHKYFRFNKARYESLKEAGRCVKCEDMAEPGKTMCRKCLFQYIKYGMEHREQINERKRRVRRERIENGLCVDCGRPTDEGHTRCKRCRDMRMDSTRKYRIHNRTLEATK
jgi:hypothetical protein